MPEPQNEPNMTPPAPYAAGTGSAPVLGGAAAFARMGYRERLALKHTDPETYRKLREEQGPQR